MIKTIFSAFVALLSAVVLSACGGGDVASPDQLELQRQIANDNSKFNAQRWRGDNGYEQAGLLTRGDSTQQPKCPQGDGWASVDLIDAKSKAVVLKLKCSTYSASVGCYKDEDFKARPVLASQENTCNAGIPKVLKKLEN